MTKRDTLSTALKIIGVVQLVAAVRATPATIFWITSGTTSSWANAHSMEGYPTLLIGGVLVWYAVSAVLIGFADAIASKLVREDAEIPAAELSQPAPVLFGLGSRVVGVVLLAQGLPDLVTEFVSVASDASSRATEAGATWSYMFKTFVLPDKWTGFVHPALILIIGGYLLFYAAHFTGLVYRSPMVDEGELDQVV